MFIKHPVYKAPCHLMMAERGTETSLYLLEERTQSQRSPRPLSSQTAKTVTATQMPWDPGKGHQ